MKLLILGDIHCLEIWKVLVSNEYDKIIFMGDYFDTFLSIPPPKWITNFLDIIEYKKANLNRVICLFGNHDYHYLSEEKYSGYNAMYSHQIKEAILANIDHLQMCYTLNGVLYSHAGITQVWCEMHGIDITLSLEEICNQINNLFKYKPQAFKFNGSNIYGDNVTQSPIWIRENSLSINKIGKTQVVGHTQKERITVLKCPSGDSIIMVDALPREVLIYEDDEFKSMVVSNRLKIELNLK